MPYGLLRRNDHGTVCRISENNADTSIVQTDIIVMDNMRSHHAKIVKQVLDESEINDLYLPPYSPDLNPIEKWGQNSKHI